MAWVTIATTRTDVDSPVTQDLMQDIVNNFTGLANGDTGSPKIKVPALIAPAAGDVIVWADTVVQATGTVAAWGTHSTKVIGRACTLKLRAGYTVAAGHFQARGIRFLVNGTTAYCSQTGTGAGSGTVTATVALVAGDTLAMQYYDLETNSTTNHCSWWVSADASAALFQVTQTNASSNIGSLLVYDVAGY